MGAKDLLRGLSERVAEQEIPFGDGVLKVRRVSPVEAMRCAAKATKDDPSSWMAELAAKSVVEDDARPLDNDEGVQLILSLPAGDFMALTQAAMAVNGFDQGNSTRASGSSTGSASPSESTTPTESMSG